MGTDFSDPATHEHIAQFYETDESLSEVVGPFLAAGLEVQDALIVIATPAHQHAFLAHLQARGLDVDLARRVGQLTLLDAHETLPCIMDGSLPDSKRFVSVVGGVIEKVKAQQPDRRIRAYGELVDLLWRGGNPKAALRLEEMWNEIGRVHSFSLLCAYTIDNFYKEPFLQGFREVCGTHTHVIPPGSSASIETSNCGALEATLRKRAQALEREVKHHKDVEQALRDAMRDLRGAEERYRAIFEQSPIGMAHIDLAGRWAHPNAKLCEILRYSAAELNRRPVVEFLHEEDREAATAQRQRFERREIESASTEERYVRKDGAIVWTHTSTSLVCVSSGEPYLLAVVNDVSDLRASDVARAELSAIVESSDDAIVSKDLQGIIRSWNLGAERVLGYTAEDAIGKPISIIAAPGLEKEMPAILEEIRNGRRVEHFETRRRRKDGRVIDVSLTVSPVRDRTGRVIGASKVLRDISEKKQFEARLQERAETLAEADRLKDEFLAILAHELRNPLAPIRNSLEFLRRRGGAEAEQVWAHEVIGRQVQQLTRLVDDLLDISRITSGKIKLQKGPVDVRAVIEQALESTRPAIQSRHHELTVSLEPDSIVLEADPTRLVQVVANLLHNAAKYTEPGGHIWLTARRDGNDAVIAVRDNGVGLRPEMLEQIFDLFVQANRDIDRTQGGLGIGLTLVRKLVAMHHGRVAASSDGLGKGSEFVVRLPISEVARAESPRRTELHASMPSARSGRRVLVVDDNVDAADSLALLLEMSGHDVRKVYDALDALEVADSFDPEIVLLDIGLPGMDGYEVARRLRRTRGESNLILVAMTGYGLAEDRLRSREAGFNHHLVKPIEPSALESVLVRRDTTG